MNRHPNVRHDDEKEVDDTHLEVVGAHEDVGDALAHDAEDPLVEVLRRLLGQRVGHLINT